MRTVTVGLLACVLAATTGCQMLGLGKAGGGDVLELGNLAESKSQTNPVPMAEGPVEIDGELADAAWADALALGDFVRGPDRPAFKTRVLVTYDEDNLYVAVVNEEPHTGDLVTNATQRDGQVWSDDCVEVYVDAWNSKDGDYYGFFVNPKNVVYDRRPAGEEGWSGEWSSGTCVIDGKVWVAELAVPFKTMGLQAKTGHKLGLMVARNRKPAGGAYVTLVPCNGEAKDTTKYPVLELK
ncbi:MAG: sugar-binding protein [Planctomycetota bacterium]